MAHDQTGELQRPSLRGESLKLLEIPLQGMCLSFYSMTHLSTSAETRGNFLDTSGYCSKLVYLVAQFVPSWVTWNSVGYLFKFHPRIPSHQQLFQGAQFFACISITSRGSEVIEMCLSSNKVFYSYSELIKHSKIDLTSGSLPQDTAESSSTNFYFTTHNSNMNTYIPQIIFHHLFSHFK